MEQTAGNSRTVLYILQHKISFQLVGQNLWGSYQDTN